MIVDLHPADTDLISQAAALLVAGFREHGPCSWPDMDSALKEVWDALQPNKICRAALDDTSQLAGWIGGLPQYGGNVWELHPLVVDPWLQRRGIGSALVHDFEARVRERGGLTILLGSDDLDDMTSLSGVDLYDNLWQRIASVSNQRSHPYEFYQKLGYTIVGVVPDANGRGKPDILMAKRVGCRSNAVVE